MEIQTMEIQTMAENIIFFADAGARECRIEEHTGSKSQRYINVKLTEGSDEILISQKELKCLLPHLRCFVDCGYLRTKEEMLEAIQ